LLLRFFIIIIISYIYLFASNPKTYASVGDPVYATIVPTGRLASLEIFKEDRELFGTYINRARDTKKEGFWLDKYKHLPEARERRKKYISTLRELAEQNKQIAKIVKDTALRIIKKGWRKTYYAIKRSKHPILKNDVELRRASLQFEKKIRAESNKRKERQRQKKQAYYRSAKNLNGKWKGSFKNRSAEFIFNKKQLICKNRSGNTVQTYEGRWHIKKNTLFFDIVKISRKAGNRPVHVRETSVTLKYMITKIGKKELNLKDRHGDMIVLRR